MPTDYAEVIDRFGNRRRLRKGERLGTVPDGACISFPVTFMDAQVSEHLAAKYGAHAPAVVDSFGFAAGHRPSHLFAATATDTRLRDAAAQARAERIERLANAWRGKYAQQDSDDSDGDVAPARTDARAVADAAYADKRQWLANAWRNRA